MIHYASQDPQVSKTQKSLSTAPEPLYAKIQMRTVQVSAFLIIYTLYSNKFLSLRVVFAYIAHFSVTPKLQMADGFTFI